MVIFQRKDGLLHELCSPFRVLAGRLVLGPLSHPFVLREYFLSRRELDPRIAQDTVYSLRQSIPKRQSCLLERAFTVTPGKDNVVRASLWATICSGSVAQSVRRTTKALSDFP